MDLTKLDTESTDYFISGTATASTAEKTPVRKKTQYCKNHCKQDLNSTYRRFEYKVLVDYAGISAVNTTSFFTQIETGDTINTLYLNTSFDNLPSSDVSDFFGNYVLTTKILYYPIFGSGSFDISSPLNQIYYTAQDYSGDGGVKYGCALLAGTTLLWCNALYQSKNKVTTAGWQHTEVDISTWGPITVHRSKYIHSWGRLLLKNGIFHNGDAKNPNIEKDNADADIDEFIAGFDYKIKESQHVAIPITLRMENGVPKKPKKITVIAHYKQSQGVAVFQRPILTKGKVSYSWLDESGNTVFESVSDAEKIAVNESTGIYSTVKSSIINVYNDNNGNILTKIDTVLCLCDTDKITGFTDEREYTYDTKHPDRLMAFGYEDISNYDSIGNPISYRGNTLTWKKGRQLSSIVTKTGLGKNGAAIAAKEAGKMGLKIIGQTFY